MDTYIKNLITRFLKNAHSEIEKGQKAYMKGRFYLYGLKSQFPPKENLKELIKILWERSVTVN